MTAAFMLLAPICIVGSVCTLQETLMDYRHFYIEYSICICDTLCTIVIYDTIYIKGR